MSNEKQETIADIITEARGVFDELLKHGYNVVSVDCMADIIDRFEAAAKLEREAGAEAAKMREALINAYYAMFKFIKTPYAECDEMAFALDAAKAALSAPPRNCDRPECATTKAAQEVWRKEDGGKTAYYEWLLETSTKGDTK